VADIFDKLEAVEDMEYCRMLLRNIKKLNAPAAFSQSDLDCELPKILLFPARIDPSL